MRVLHPFLFALFLLLGAWYEVRPLGDAREALVCAPALLLIAGALFLVFRLALKSSVKAALLATLLLAYLGLSGELSIGLAAACRARSIPLFGAVIPCFILLSALAAVPAALILLAKRDLARLNQTVLVIVSALLLTTAAGMALDRREAAWRKLQAPPPVAVNPAAHRPDIYFIIMDSYTSLDQLRAYWDYESADLKAFLDKNGFQVAPGARSEYKFTTFCLASRLNMGYPPGFLKDWQDRYTRNAMIALIEGSSVPAVLTAAGYRVVNLSMTSLGEVPAKYPISSFLCFRSVRQMILDRSIKRMTMTKPVRPWKTKARHLAEGKLQPFKDLEAVADEPAGQPRFVFAHLMIPHGPMVFRRDGTLFPQVPPQKASNAEYLDQTVYCTARLIRTLTHILQRYPPQSPPVIVLQGDHGCRYFKGDPGLAETESYGMLNAVLLPGLTEGELRDIPPANTFRLVFNRLFDAGLPYATNAGPIHVAGDVIDD